MNKISLAEARSISIAAQGLFHNNSWKGKAGALRAIEHLGYVQIDTLSVIVRAHQHTLWSRCEGYQEQYINQLMKEKRVFEYWSHAASYLPIQDYKFTLGRKSLYANGKSHWFGQDSQMKKFVLERITQEGPLRSRDFAHLSNSPGQWYAWKPAKQALEQLFMEGKLMVVMRKGFQKLYDLTERVLPKSIDTTMPSEDEAAQHLILKAVAAHGVITESEIGYLRGYAKKAIPKNIKYLLKEGAISAFKVGSLPHIYYGRPEYDHMLPSENTKAEVHILSPFDNFVIQRKRLQMLFAWEYTLECYTPEPKRQFGYFCLPILYGERLVARIDPKADPANKTFYIKRFHADPDWKLTEAFALTFAKKLWAFAAFNGCVKIEAGSDLPAMVRKELAALPH